MLLFFHYRLDYYFFTEHIHTWKKKCVSEQSMYASVFSLPTPVSISYFSLWRSKFRHSLGSLRYCMLCKFSGEHEAYSSLNLTRWKRRFLVVPRQLSSLWSNSFEDIINKWIHDWHSPLADSSVGVHLFQYLVDVGAVRLGAFRRPLFHASFFGRLKFLQLVRWAFNGRISSLQTHTKAPLMLTVLEQQTAQQAME